MKTFLLLAYLCAAGIACAQSAASFRYIHISDTHVGSPTGAEDLRRTVSDINTLDGIQCVIVTGDITEFGADDQLRLAKQILDSLKYPWYVTPGNHDMKWGGSAGTSFRKIFGYEHFSFTMDGVTFIGLHEGPRLKMGDGFWAPEDLTWLESELKKAGRERPIIIATHYPIDDGIANWYEVLNRVKEYNVQAFIYGHGHRNRADMTNGIPGVMGRSNLRARDSVGGYNIVTVRHDTMFYQLRRPLIGDGPVWDTVLLHLDPRTVSRPEVPPPAFTVNDSFPGVRSVWRKNTGYLIASSPALWKSTVIVGDASGSISAYNEKNGKTVWTFKANDGIFSTPAVSAGRVVFGSADSTIYCLDANTGALQWKIRTDAAVVASPVISGTTVYIGASDHRFRAIDLKSGKALWTFTGVAGTVECTPAVSGDKIYFGAWDEHLYCLDANTGALLWTWKGDHNGALFSPAACTPVVQHGNVFIAAPDRYLTAIDAATGRTVWRTNQYQVRETIGGSMDGARVYVRTMTDSLYAISASTDEPQVVWGLDARFGYDINSAMIVEKEGRIFYPTKNGVLIAVDGTTGTLLWKHKSGLGITNTPVPLSGTKVVITNFDGTIEELVAKN